MLISDFDDIDKNMADASQVFRNVKTYMNLTTFHTSTMNRKNTKTFFSNFTDDNNSELKNVSCNYGATLKIYITTLEHVFSTKALHMKV